MWHVSAPYETSDPAHLESWIEIYKSQLKVRIRPEDLNIEICEPDRWSFDVVSCSHPLKSSEMHHDFLQILEDRVVPRGTIQELNREGLQAHLDELDAAFDDPVAPTLWRNKQFGYADDGETAKDLPGLPPSASLTAQLLLEKAGYIPRECAPLAQALIKMAEFQLQNLRKEMRASCLKSTTAVGIADPYGVLKPGEILSTIG